MNRLLSTLLVWLLMGMLPLHAVAGSINMSCAPVLPQVAVPLADQHMAHAASSDMHAHHGDHAMTEADAAFGDDGSHANVEKSTHSSCSACSIFCAGAVAPPSFSLSLPVFDGSSAASASPADFVAGFIPDGLRRPPRQ
ncbi:hypothetical protein [Massilia sp. UYP11]|uniref:hypothetical protein n=1 Tax=Massilia sp. UYP11 TaxID=1756385 RepID=UPI003D1F193E